MTVNLWTPEAERLTPRGTAGTMSGVGGPRATLHCTVSNPGSFDAMHRVLTGKKGEPHYLYDPKTDRLGQYFPLDRSARALLGSPSVNPSHNKAGTYNVQVEICAMPDDWTKGWTPGPKFRAMMRDIAALGVAPKFVFDLPRNGSATERDRVARPASVIYGAAGGGLWWGHCHYKRPEIHWDPGPINEARFFSGYPDQEDEMSAEDVKKVIDHFNAVSLYGYSEGGVPKPSLLAVLAETQRRVTRTENALRALAVGLGPAVEEAVRKALSEEYDATVELTKKTPGATKQNGVS